jgi:hypothetical protein
MDDFLDRYHIPKLIQEQMNYPNRPTSNKEIEVIKNLPIKKKKKKKKKKRPGPDGFSALVQNSIRPSKKT